VNIKANGCWYRYSNTLLVSLNNRIAIRDSEVSPDRGAILTSGKRPALTAKGGPSIVHLEIAKSPAPCAAFEERKQSGESLEDDAWDGVSGKCFGASFPVFF
jgi:hypothetical protein